jgi:tRNA uridine 5-carboxymethylaminomethyl modification enzyme
MFTSRAEFRLMLSQDNACQRLTRRGNELGLIADKTYKNFLLNEEKYQTFFNNVKKIKTEQNNKPTTGAELLKRTDINQDEIKELLKVKPEDETFFLRAANEIKYSGYIDKQKREVESARKNEKTTIPNNTDYSKIKGLSNEVIERLNKSQPSSLGQAGRLEGVTPAAINLISITIKKNQTLKKAETH